MHKSRNIILKAGSAALVIAAFFALQCTAYSSEGARIIPPPTQDESASTSRTETAVLSGGCFWGVQGVFQHVRGVKEVVSGYSGGTANTAHYERVSEGDTGHAESVRVTYDPSQITYGSLLRIFFSVAHDPTQLNFQGPDHGTQYRSALFPLDAKQREVAAAYIVQLDAAHVFKGTIATRIEDYRGFYPAENYHQNYLAEHPESPYIAINDMPKIAGLKRLYPTLYRNDPALVAVTSR
ncbi:peptide-methionine (S)-S-oxide reductase MsrA [Caballeronia sp. Lep1P3]|uniref:peptide-methionine (S)-S-oxide reductase MsrA n=1 Tax=Caballeronia sp. Lep1P3 TaxID=2878150 RepID=UPI001FD6255F|nr:peptide-methionine (S)-S-oxide reductase MsrA [Caballeronia sp. Lep1P3]